jgi:hypothetical protein
MDAADAATQRLLLQPEVARLVASRPHHFPPSVNPPYSWRDGKVLGKRLDNHNMSTEVWNANHCQTVHWVVICVEATPRGVRKLRADGRPNTLSMVFGDGGTWEHRFANCMHCWKTQTRNFSNPGQTPSPYSTDVQNGALPQLGSCGCVVCNGCIIQCFNQAPQEKFVPCPYCAIPNSFHRDVKAWMLSNGVFGRGI